MGNGEPFPQSSGRGGFTGAIKTALWLFDHTRVAIVAVTAARGEYIRELIVDALDAAAHAIVILDESIGKGERDRLTLKAMQGVPGCTVIEIKSWTPPALS